jgi:hypothetical protein
MKKPEISKPTKSLFHQCLLPGLALAALLVTGCPRNEYTVELKPQGNQIERTLIFYRADGMDTNTGLPNYQPFDTNELAAIATCYPSGPGGEGNRHVARGRFTDQLPDDVGGAGVYLHLSTSLGQAGFYSERIRGNDDLAGLLQRRFEAADRLADLFVGWSQAELGTEPGHGPLRQFLDADFRRDLKNLAAYLWQGELAAGYQTNAAAEYLVRFSQYALERGYFTSAEIPALFQEISGNDHQALLALGQRLVARKMGVPETEPVPATLAFLADEASLSQSLERYLAGTDLYQARLKQWEEDKKLNPELPRPEPSQLVDSAIGDLIAPDPIGQADHLTVRLSLPAAPVRSNGRWDKALRQIVWEADIGEKANASHFPVFCYAFWAQPDSDNQTRHFGRVILTGEDLTQYCLWRSRQDAERGCQWDSFVAGLQPGSLLPAELDAFRFSGEPIQSETNGQEKAFSPSAFPRELLKSALSKSADLPDQTGQTR